MKAVSRRFKARTQGGSMATDCITQVTFQGDGFPKPVVTRFDLPDASADGGLVLFKALDTKLGLTRRLADCLDDAREPGKVLHETLELLQQRVFGLCGGYADCNDAARLVHDPIHKLVLDRDPLTGLGLASQPTLSRFENAVSAQELRAMTHALADAAVLRPGTAPAVLGARGILRGLLRKLRAAFPGATFRVRLDGGFASPKLFLFLEREQVEYVVAMASNRRLEKRAQRLMGRARMLSRQTGQTAHLYGETRYAAKKWTRQRRAARTVCADAQVTTLRERLVKLAVWVERSARRIVLHLPLSFPWLPTWRQLARAVGATT